MVTLEAVMVSCRSGAFAAGTPPDPETGAGFGKTGFGVGDWGRLVAPSGATSAEAGGAGRTDFGKGICVRVDVGVEASGCLFSDCWRVLLGKGRSCPSPGGGEAGTGTARVDDADDPV